MIYLECFPSKGDIKEMISTQMNDNQASVATDSRDSSGNSCTSGTSSGRHTGAANRSRSGSGSRGSSSSSSSKMDELSIDSATNEKIKIDNFNAKNNQAAKDNKCHQKQHSNSKLQNSSSNVLRPHFKIEWRQLTYYQKERSYLSKLLFNEDKKHSETCEQIKNNDGGANSEPKRILNSLDGCFRSGELSAILGPSGAGKSTFLSTLFGSKQEGAYGQTKVTWFASDNCRGPIVERRSIRIASLPQHDHLLDHLTVYESLMFASKIKNASRPGVTSKSFHRQNVRRVSKMLKLGECLDTRCGKLSGGQYKRVSIGQELLSEPDVIILDEPTSGLDAMTCLTTVQTLKSIAMKHPISIILTIHQPDIDVFNLFDHVYVIAQGGLAIYEGPPNGIVSTLAQVDLNIPSPSYNPARFIVENAFVFEPSTTNGANLDGLIPQARTSRAHISDDPGCGGDSTSDSQSSSSDDDDDNEDAREKQGQGYLRRSVLSLTEVISGKEMVGKTKKDKKPLLNIGIQTLDGKLITSDHLARNKDREQHIERWNLLRRLNQIQKARYRGGQDLAATNGASNYNQGDGLSPELSEPVSPENPCHELQQQNQAGSGGRSSAKSDYSSSGWSVHRKQITDDNMTTNSTGFALNATTRLGKASSLAQMVPAATGQAPISATNLVPGHKLTGRSLQTVHSGQTAGIISSASDRESMLMSEEEEEEEEVEFVSVNFPTDELSLGGKSPPPPMADTQENHFAMVDRRHVMKRQFDKRLSAKHNCSKQKGYPIWYHSLLLAHRTWLSIVRDPVFFGIQACMHITIPILLSLIFGSSQDEGCPRVGNFDLVDFAYSDTENMIQGTVSSIRKSVGNIGIVFFEMFVLMFAINCITALVFPLDMYVLLKEYRNGWYSLKSYLLGRTLADLPVPVILHSIAITILYFMTGQPHSLWRYASIVCLVIIASLVAQSVGLTIGALLMKSSQSSVLAAAGIVAPFFALSGFIVRIHTLPLVAQVAAQGSYLYHLLNGFIILRYGFGRCQCKTEDFEQNSAHQIPSNLHTLASIWIGTYSDEYSNSQAMLASNGGRQTNRTNVDPNIDVVDKMMTAFKMANSYGHQIHDCEDVIPYAMLDFNLRDHDIYGCFIALIAMVIVSRFITFGAIYYKIRSFA